jgi:hypothetical protein
MTGEKSMPKVGRKRLFSNPRTIGLLVENRKYLKWLKQIAPERPPERLRRHIDADLGLCDRPGGE